MTERKAYYYVNEKGKFTGRYLADDPVQAACKIFTRICHSDTDKYILSLREPDKNTLLLDHKFKICEAKTKQMYNFIGSQGYKDVINGIYEPDTVSMVISDE